MAGQLVLEWPLREEVMVKKADIPRHVIDTAMKLAAERGWRDLSLAEIADAAKLPLSKVYPVLPSKTAMFARTEL